MSAPYLVPLTCFWAFHQKVFTKELFSQGTMWNVKVGPEVLDFIFEVKSQGNMDYYYSWPHLSLKLMRLKGTLSTFIFAFLYTYLSFCLGAFHIDRATNCLEGTLKKNDSLLTEHFWHQCVRIFPTPTNSPILQTPTRCPTIHFWY